MGGLRQVESRERDPTGVILTGVDDVFYLSGEENYLINALQPIRIHADEGTVNSFKYLDMLTELRTMITHAGIGDLYNNVTSMEFRCDVSGFRFDCSSKWSPLYYGRSFGFESFVYA